MAGQRGYVGRSRDDLYATAESVGEMLAQCKSSSSSSSSSSIKVCVVRKRKERRIKCHTKREENRDRGGWLQKG